MWNKSDLLSPVTRAEAASAARFDERHPILVSAKTGAGLEALLEAIDARLGSADEIVTLTIPPGEGRLMHWLYEHGDIVARAEDDRGLVTLTVRIASEKKGRLLHQLQKAGVAQS